MNQICRDIFRAIHEGKWLKIEYRNKADQVTKYWIGIRDIDPRPKSKQWFNYYNGKEIVLPDKFLPEKEFIEYHNDVIFQGAWDKVSVYRYEGKRYEQGRI